MTERAVPEGTRAHRADAAKFSALQCAVLTVSDSRSAATDTAGDTIVAQLQGAGHTVAVRTLLTNEESLVRAQVSLWLARADLHAILITGGTGLSARDRTIEAVRPLFEKEIDGFGELFRQVSFQEQVGATAMLSRATAGSAQGALIVVMPGSRAAVDLAMSRLIIPELPHLLREIRR